MKKTYIRINLILFSYYLLLFLGLISYSQSENINLLSLNPINYNEPFNEENNNPREMNEKCEELREKQKILEETIESLIHKNNDYDLKIEVNKIYIKILYILISILIIIFIIIIIFKFYSQFKKRPNNFPLINLKEKYRNNELSSNKSKNNSN